MKNYYSILGVDIIDDTEEIKKKTIKKLKKVDYNSQQYNDMKEAYNVLTSYFKRQKYDRLYKQQYYSKDLSIPKGNNNFSLFDDSLTTMNNMINPMVSIPKGNNNYSKTYSYSSIMKQNKDGNYEKKENWRTNNNNKKREKNKTTIYDINGNII